MYHYTPNLLYNRPNLHQYLSYILLVKGFYYLYLLLF
uniref:Uncharacterized protein n=1 Tax=Myoviridae sp. ctcyQ27 TaxID=2825139 RepID=A0A8S5UFC9_9CAUD|nr:MAG TPA: hypothetical protein [Myoviridae sp. ctcyQ27]